jgi:tetratricopeptide (TPR) repeat protein
MEPGSIRSIVERLAHWCRQHERGLARVEWDSMYTRKEVVNRLKLALGNSDIPLIEIDLPPGEDGYKTAVGLVDQLRSSSGSAASITGIEWAFPEGGNKLDTLVVLSFQREILASLLVRQIWWVPSSATERFILGVPDLDSWFSMRLHLTEVPLQPAIETTDRQVVSVAYARSLARRFWDRLETVRAQNIPEERIWTELAEPAVNALRSAGLGIEADAVLSQMSDARERLERQIREFSLTRGPEDAEAISLTEQLARLLMIQGDYAGARLLQERVLGASARVLGGEHHNTLTAMNNLAETLRAQGDLVGAQRLQERVLEARRQALGEERPDTLTSMNNLAATRLAQGDLAGARRLLERVLDTRTRVLGEEHPDTRIAMNNLAHNLWAQGDFAGARRLQERVLAARSRVLGADHPDTLAKGTGPPRACAGREDTHARRRAPGYPRGHEQPGWDAQDFGRCRGRTAAPGTAAEGERARAGR